MSRYKTPNRSESGGIIPVVDKYKAKNNGYGYKDFRFFRERGVNTANLARIFGKTWSTIREWETLDDEEFGAPESLDTPEDLKT